MCYNYNDWEKEYVFAYHGRPFSVLVSKNFPTPSSSYVGHHLVLELGLKLKEVQCKKISFCGKKLRLLGKVSCTVQCVVDGSFLGNFNFKASVIEDIKFHFDLHCIACPQNADNEYVPSSPESEVQMQMMVKKKKIKSFCENCSGFHYKHLYRNHDLQLWPKVCYISCKQIPYSKYNILLAMTVVVKFDNQHDISNLISFCLLGLFL